LPAILSSHIDQDFMITVAISKFIHSFGEYNELAQYNDVAIARHGRIIGYYVSAHKYEEYQRIKRRNDQVLVAEDSTPTKPKEIANAKALREWLLSIMNSKAMMINNTTFYAIL